VNDIEKRYALLFYPDKAQWKLDINKEKEKSRVFPRILHFRVLCLYTLISIVDFMVEVRGVEPLSETVSVRASPGAVHVLTFPPLYAHEQAYSFSSFILSCTAQSFAVSRSPLVDAPSRAVVLPRGTAAFN